MKPLPIQVVPIPSIELRKLMSKIEDTWEEVDQRKSMGMSLEPDWETIAMLELCGSLFCYKIGGGYGVFIKSKDIHRKGKSYVTSSVIYLPKQERGRFSEALPTLEKDFKKTGADLLSITLKTRKTGSYNGYELYEQTYQRAL